MPQTFARWPGGGVVLRRALTAVVVVLLGLSVLPPPSASAAEATTATTAPETTTATSASTVTEPVPGEPVTSGADGVSTPSFVGAPWFEPGKVYSQNFPDPDILYDPGTDRYYAYATMTGGVYVPAMWSTDAVTWTARANHGIQSDTLSWNDALPHPLPAGWPYVSGDPLFRADLWAPAVGKVGSRWVMFYALRQNSAGRRCLVYATADNPLGPFTNPNYFYCSGDPLGTIDPDIFTDPANGTTYLVWKDEGWPDRYGQRTWARPIRMSSSTTVEFVPGTIPHFLLESANNWEEWSAESPTLTRLPQGGLALFYSGNRWDTDAYATGAAMCGELVVSLTPQCTRVSADPLMQRRPGRKAIGAPTITQDRDGGLLLATHSWAESLPSGYNTSVPSNQRRMTVERLYQVAGRLVVSGEPGPTGPAGPAGYVPTAPARVLDTRNGTGTTAARALEGGEVFVLDLASRVPSGTTAVVLNLTVDGSSRNGFVTAYPCGTPPNASNLNFPGGTVVPNLATVQVNAARRVCLYTQSPTHLVVDLQGRYATSGTDGLVGVGPVRIHDTRSGAPVPAGGLTRVQVAGSAAGWGVPSGVEAVAVNLTSDRAAAPGFLTAYACDSGRPVASNANYVPGVPASNAAMVPVAADGSICIYSHARTDVIVDLFGYVGSGGGSFSARSPVRLRDTRDGGGPPVGAGGVLSVQVVGPGAAPAGTTSVVLTVTATDARAAGWVGAYPCASPPTSGYTSNLNIRAGETRAAQVTVPVGPDGKVCFYTLNPTHLIADLAGSYD